MQAENRKDVDTGQPAMLAPWEESPVNDRDRIRLDARVMRNE
jgi:hypothetical protein